MARFFRRSFGGSASSSADYIQSNSIETIPNCPRLSSSYRSAIVEAKRDTANYSQSKTQELVDYVCGKLHIPSVRVVVVDTPCPHRTKDNGRFGGGKLGHYKHLGNCAIEIRIWNLTAMKGQRRAAKSFFETAVHELCHHIDMQLLGLGKSLHTAGFYKRIGDLSRRLGA